MRIVLKSYAPNTLKIPQFDFMTPGAQITGLLRKLLKENKNTNELLFIGFLILGLSTFALNNPTLNKFTIFLLSYCFICLLLATCILFLILSYRITIQHITDYKKGGFENLKEEINSNFLLTISKKSVFFSFTSFLFSSIMVFFTIYRVAIVFFLGGFLLLKEMPLIKNWITNLNQQNYKITEKFRDNYLKFYEFNRFCKWICFIYFIYFV
jgi:hypothetical protein